MNTIRKKTIIIHRTQNDKRRIENIKKSKERQRKIIKDTDGQNKMTEKQKVSK